MKAGNRIPLAIAIPLMAALVVAGPACESSPPPPTGAPFEKRSPPEPSA